MSVPCRGSAEATSTKTLVAMLFARNSGGYPGWMGLLLRPFESAYSTRKPVRSAYRRVPRSTALGLSPVPRPLRLWPGLHAKPAPQVRSARVPAMEHERTRWPNPACHVRPACEDRPGQVEHSPKPGCLG